MRVWHTLVAVAVLTLSTGSGGQVSAGDTLLARCYTIDPAGYVVVPVLKELPPVKACSDDSDLDVDQTGGFPQLLRDVLRLRLRAFAKRFGSLDVRQSETGQDMFDPRNRAEWDRLQAPTESFTALLDSGVLSSLTQVGPFITTSWHQSQPYNNFCPLGDGGRCVAGQVAIAIAQIMQYHEWPSSGCGEFTYYWDGDESCGGQVGGGYLTADFSDPYEWEHMPDDCLGGCDQTEQDALAELCYEVGVAMEMDYGVCGSSTDTHFALTKLPSFFQYDESIDHEARADHTAQSWFEMVQEDLNSGNPILYGLLWRTVLCDGWRDTGGLDQYHINFGGGDPHTGWYAVDNIYGSDDPLDEYMIRRIMPRGPETIDDAPPSFTTTLCAPMPNPSWQQTSLQYSLARPGQLTIDIFDPTGRLLRRLYSGHTDKGDGTVTWDGRGSDGSPVGPGIYFCRLCVNGELVSQREVARVR